MSTDFVLDTNILLRYVESKSPLHQATYDAIEKLQFDGSQLFVLPQSCAEFWNVSTRPLNRNGFGKTPLQTNLALQRIEQLFTILPDIPSIYTRWRQLIVRFAVSGVQVHDARLVAAMLAHGISSILTFNSSDFLRYASAGIFVVEPNSLLTDSNH